MALSSFLPGPVKANPFALVELGFSQFPLFCYQYCRKTETRLPDRVQSLRDHCTRAEVPVGSFKQKLTRSQALIVHSPAPVKCRQEDHLYSKPLQSCDVFIPCLAETLRVQGIGLPCTGLVKYASFNEATMFLH